MEAHARYLDALTKRPAMIAAQHNCSGRCIEETVLSPTLRAAIQGMREVELAVQLQLGFDVVSVRSGAKLLSWLSVIELWTLTLSSLQLDLLLRRRNFGEWQHHLTSSQEICLLLSTSLRNKIGSANVGRAEFSVQTSPALS